MTDSEAMAQVFAAQTRALLYNLQPDVIADKKARQQQIETCFYVEWAQDMGRKIPFCKITGEYCSGQCNFCPNCGAKMDEQEGA